MITTVDDCSVSITPVVVSPVSVVVESCVVDQCIEQDVESLGTQVIPGLSLTKETCVERESISDVQDLSPCPFHCD